MRFSTAITTPSDVLIPTAVEPSYNTDRARSNVTINMQIAFPKYPRVLIALHCFKHSLSHKIATQCTFSYFNCFYGIFNLEDSTLRRESVYTSIA